MEFAALAENDSENHESYESNECSHTMPNIRPICLIRGSLILYHELILSAGQPLQAVLRKFNAKPNFENLRPSRWVVAAFEPRIAASDANYPSGSPANKTVLVYRFNKVRAARRVKPAVAAKHWADRQLIKSNQ